VDNNFLILFFSENAAIIVPDIEFPKHKSYKFIIDTFTLNIIIDVKKIFFQLNNLSLLTANKVECHSNTFDLLVLVLLFIQMENKNK
jgi:hypothetical protein